MEARLFRKKCPQIAAQPDTSVTNILLIKSFVSLRSGAEVHYRLMIIGNTKGVPNIPAVTVIKCRCATRYIAIGQIGGRARSLKECAVGNRIDLVPIHCDMRVPIKSVVLIPKAKGMHHSSQDG